jgi:superfamily II DNA or RNA helicase
MTFDGLLARADTAALQDLLGVNVVRLLQALNPELARPQALRSTLVSLHPASELLLDPTSRPLLLELLRREEAARLLDHLGLPPAPDPYPGLLALQPRRGSGTATLLLSFFGVSEPPPEPLPPVPPTEAKGGYELFPHQRTAVRSALRLSGSHPYRVLIHMPTGSGKTRTAMSLLADHLRAVEPTLVVWLAASEELCDQAADEFRLAWSRLGNRTLPTFRWWGASEFPADLPSDGMVIAGLAKLYSRAIADPPWLARLGDRTSVVVFDEAHQAIAPTYRHIVDAITARKPDLRLVGLTATPGRTWNDIEADAQLSDYFARRKVVLEVPGYSNPVEYLFEQGYLARPRFRSIEQAGPTLTEREREKIAEDLDLPTSVLKKLADDHLRNLAIAHEVRALARRHRRILVFSATVEHAELLAVVLSSIGVEARAVTTLTTNTQRPAAIAWYRQPSDDIRVLTNFGVLTTGFDAPMTSAAVIARPTKSLVLYSQMVGRATRGIRAGGNREAEIVTVVDVNLPGFRTLSEAFTNWEDVWRPRE